MGFLLAKIQPMKVKCGCSFCGTKQKPFTPHNIFTYGSYRKTVCISCGGVTEQYLIKGEWVFKEDLEAINNGRTTRY